VHITLLSSRLSKTCYALREIKPFMSIDLMKSIYYYYAHAILSYGIIFWGNSRFTNIIFKNQKKKKKKKRIIRVITGTGRYDSCRELFRKLEILLLQSQYIFSLLVFVIKNKSYFTANSNIHDINTRFNRDLHLPATNLTLVQKGVIFYGSRIYNQLP
jgi:hypothetical protein